MKKHLAKRVHNLKSSSVFAFLKQAQEMKKQGRDIISLSIGEPEWDTFENIKQAGKEAIDQGYTKYTSSNGREDLRVKLAKWYKKEFDIPYHKDNLTITAGCKYALFTIFQCLCNEGDEVIVPAPYWVSYLNIIELSGAQPKIVSCQPSSGFKITPEQLRKAITKKTRIFLLNSPNNPTSAVYSKKELQALGEVLMSFPEVFIVTDDIYDRLVFEGDRSPHLLNEFPALKQRLFAVNGASKSWLMTGWRLAWILGEEDFYKSFLLFPKSVYKLC